MIGARTTTVAMGLLAVSAGVLTARSLARAPALERPLPPPPATAEHLRPALLGADFSPASRAEAVLVGARVFGIAVVMTAEEPAVGDFNGDGSPDLALAVRPGRGQAAFVADPLANWTVQDCEGTPPLPHTPLAAPPTRPAMAAGEGLLAVIHGYGRKGWRDSEARQGYLVRTGIDGGWRALAREGHAVPVLPRSRGGRDVLVSPARAGTVVFWRGGSYTCRPDAPAGR